jgi:hypothetical protein
MQEHGMSLSSWLASIGCVVSCNAAVSLLSARLLQRMPTELGPFVVWFSEAEVPTLKPLWLRAVSALA